MARMKSDDRRNAILEATTRVIVAQGLSAPTATIAKEAGISSGSLFTYFETKSDLFNQLYLELKAGMAAALDGFPEDAELRVQVSHLWANWMKWATSHPEQRRALAQLSVSDQVTPETRAAAFKMMAKAGALFEQIRKKGALRDAPPGFVGAVTTSLAETTMDLMINDPAKAKQHCSFGFETFWRAMN